MIVTIFIILTSKAAVADSVDLSPPPSANLTDTSSTGNFSAFENRIRRKMAIAGIKSFFRRLRHRMENAIDRRIYP
uniref:Uncharacterized protein n=1 Tax=Romanomermis culicivorax TaxID=13658 RepID=A0A915IUK7_ROMCU